MKDAIQYGIQIELRLRFSSVFAHTQTRTHTDTCKYCARTYVKKSVRCKNLLFVAVYLRWRRLGLVAEGWLFGPHNDVKNPKMPPLPATLPPTPSPAPAPAAAAFGWAAWAALPPQEVGVWAWSLLAELWLELGAEWVVAVGTARGGVAAVVAAGAGGSGGDAQPSSTLPPLYSAILFGPPGKCRYYSTRTSMLYSRYDRWHYLHANSAARLLDYKSNETIIYLNFNVFLNLHKPVQAQQRPQFAPPLPPTWAGTSWLSTQLLSYRMASRTSLPVWATSSRGCGPWSGLSFCWMKWRVRKLQPDDRLDN